MGEWDVISFFPTAYEDEILYSLINRYHMRSGNVSYSDTIKDLYNNRYTKSILDLPNSNKELLDNINLGFQLDEFIKQTSLVRYYTAFLDKEKIENVINQLSDSGCRGIHSIVGASQRISRYDGYFKICFECYYEEIDEWGEGYFHRIHQVPAVFVCSKHRCALKRSKKPFSFYSNNFISIDQMEFVDFKEVKIIGDNINMFISLANDCDFILNNDVDNKDIEWFNEQYKNRLKQLNLCTPKGIVNINEVKSRFVDFYGKDVLSLFNLDTFNEEGTNWIKYIIRNKRYVLNPLKHILFIKFLGIDIREIFSKNIEYKPFGNGPWPCMNKICDNYKKKVINEVEISYNSKKKRPVGKFKCECGYTYSRVAVGDSDNDSLGKIIQMGWLWEAKLRTLINQDFSLNYIERELKTSQKTIKKYALKLGYQDYVYRRSKVKEHISKEEKDKIKRNKKTSKIEEYRKIWLALIKQNPNMTITQLRESNIKVQDYLYRNDREWLYENYPERTKHTSGNILVDWDERDREILEMVKNAVDKLYNEGDITHEITLTYIGKIINKESFILTNIGRLPLTDLYIKEIRKNFIKNN